MATTKIATFAERLREFRLSAGISQYALAKRAGVPKQSVNRIEAGYTRPLFETACKLARALDRSVADFE